MTNYVWNGVDGNWNDPSNWTPTEAPGYQDNATIDAAGTYTVTVNEDTSVASLTMDDPSATLDIAAGTDFNIFWYGTFDLEAGTLVNEGVLSLFYATLKTSGAVTFAQGTYWGESGAGPGGDITGNDLTFGTAALVENNEIEAQSLVNDGTFFETFIDTTTFTNNGTIIPYEEITGNVINNGLIQVFFATDNEYFPIPTFLAGSIDNTGTIAIANGGSLVVYSGFDGVGAANLGTVAFADLAAGISFDPWNDIGTLSIYGTALTTGTLVDFNSGDAVIAGASGNDALSYVGDQLTLTVDGTAIADFTMIGDYTESDFTFENGVLTTDVTCFVAGTRILTPSGEIPVEKLRIGDPVVTQSGTARPVKWIGRRAYDGRFIAGNRDALPIRIRAGALADNVPHRDLLISPHHAIFLDGVLIPAEQLVNDVSIRQEEAVARVDYFHVELETHDVLIAEGSPAESFLDADSRLLFQNAAEFAALYPDAEPQVQCARRVTGGEALRRVWGRIARRAGIAEAARGALRGRLDVIDTRHVEGWACDGSEPVWVSVVIDGVPVARGLANRFRPDLAKAGIGRGWHGFRIVLPRALDPSRAHRVSVRREADGAELPGSPFVPAARAA